MLLKIERHYQRCERCGRHGQRICDYKGRQGVLVPLLELLPTGLGTRDDISVPTVIDNLEIPEKKIVGAVAGDHFSVLCYCRGCEHEGALIEKGSGEGTVNLYSGTADISKSSTTLVYFG